MRGKFELDLLRDEAGNAVVVTGATVSVLIEGTGVPADLYDDITGVSGPGNPFTVTGSTISFFADQYSRYRIDITTTSGYSRTLRYRNVSVDLADVQAYADTQIAAHSAMTDNVHGISSGDAIESVSGAQAKADAVQTNLTTHINSTTPHPNLTLDFEKITYPTAYQIGSPDHNDILQEVVDHAWSAGVTHGGNITDNGDGTISLDITDAMLRSTADEHVTLYNIKAAAQGPISLTDNSENYVYFDYNGGSPQWNVSTSRAAFNCLDKCIGYYIYRNGTHLNIIDARGQNVDGNRKSRQLFLKFRKFIHADGGTSLGSNGLALTVSAGEFFYMLQSLPHNAFDTSVSGIANENVFTLWYRDGVGGWTETQNEKVIDTTVYDNNTGTPVAISNNKYSVSWIYIAHNSPSSLHAVMGQADYATVADAEAASPPATLPGLLGAHGSLIGFVIYLKSATSFVDILSAFERIFTASAATEHNGLSGIQGGQINEYYHLTNTEHTAYGYHARERTTAAPNATVPVHSLSSTGAETDIDIALSPKGTGAILAQIPDGTTTGGNKRGAYAVDLQMERTSATQVASGNYSFTTGYGNTSSGQYSFTSGDLNTASGSAASAIGFGCTSSGSYSHTSGNQCAASGIASEAHGALSSSYADYGYASGLRATSGLIYGKKARASGFFASDGDAQIGTYVIRASTTDATATILTTNASSAATTNVATLPNNSAFTVSARVVGVNTSTGDTFDTEIKGTVFRGATAATTVLVNTPVYTTISQSAGAAGWIVELVANTTRGSAEIQVSGETGTAIHWVCEFNTVEVG